MPEYSTGVRTASLLFRGITRARKEIELETTEIERELNETRDRPVSNILETVVDRVRSLMNADGAAIALRDEWGMVCQASAGEAPSVGSRPQRESSLTRRCIENGELVIYENTEEDSQSGGEAPSLRLRSAVIAPLHVQEDSLMGVMAVLSCRAGAFSSAHILGLERIAYLLVPILQSDRQPKQF